jgi:hypothetical protein
VAPSSPQAEARAGQPRGYRTDAIRALDSALELPDLADPGVGGPLARRLALERFDEARRSV